MRVEVEVGTRSRPAGAIGLLVPSPIDLPWQSFEGFEGFEDAFEDAKAIAPEGRGPAAFLIERPSDGFAFRMSYEGADGDVPTPLFAGLDAGSDSEDGMGAEWVDEAMREGTLDARTRAAVARVAAQFDYGPRNADLGADLGASLSSCDLVTGNCVDINTVLLGCLERLEVPASYVAGYYFAAADEPAHGMHCWVATMTESGYLEWDVAHALQAGRPATDPLDEATRGMRAAVSCGRNIAYDVHGRRCTMEHFVQPRWLLADGSAPMAAVEARLAA